MNILPNLTSEDIDTDRKNLICEFPVIIKMTDKNSLSAYQVGLYVNNDEILPREYYVFKWLYGSLIKEYEIEDFKKLNQIVPIKNYPIYEYNTKEEEYKKISFKE